MLLTICTKFLQRKPHIIKSQVYVRGWEEGRGVGLIGGVGATLLQRQPGVGTASWKVTALDLLIDFSVREHSGATPYTLRVLLQEYVRA